MKSFKLFVFALAIVTLVTGALMAHGGLISVYGNLAVSAVVLLTAAKVSKV